MAAATTAEQGGIFQPDSTWLTICRAVCGVLHIAGPLHPDQARRLLAILRNELARSALPTQPGAWLDPWYYLTSRDRGLVVLSAPGRRILQQPPNLAAKTLIKNTITHWRKTHDQTA